MQEPQQPSHSGGFFFMKIKMPRTTKEYAGVVIAVVAILAIVGGVVSSLEQAYRPDSSESARELDEAIESVNRNSKR